MQDLTGKIALVTGGARNVGKAIAATLADHGAHVLVNYFHSHEQAKETQRELRARGAQVDLLRASVARPEQVERMFAEIEQRFGRLDILVNNAADGALVPGPEVTDAHLDKALDTNLKGGLRCARAALPLMRRAGGGSIVNISALGCSQLVMANYLACAPAKAAVEAAARYLAVEFAPFGIRVNTASAAMLLSEVADAFPDAGAMQHAVAASTPLGRLGTPEEFAEVVAFLASDRSRWITGQVVLADGGLSLGAPLLSPPGSAPAALAPEAATTAPDPAATATETAAATAVGAAAPTATQATTEPKPTPTPATPATAARDAATPAAVASAPAAPAPAMPAPAAREAVVATAAAAPAPAVPAPATPAAAARDAVASAPAAPGSAASAPATPTPATPAAAAPATAASAPATPTPATPAAAAP
ncbi:SDR family oxidoreductase, partial [Streptomyces solaniscabiei]